MTRHRRNRPVIAALYAGLGLTIIATIALYVDRATVNLLADHIRAGYPAYPRRRVDTAVTAWLVYLSVVGTLGISGWCWTIWALRAGRRWARGAATVMCALGVGTALFNLLVRDTSGDTGLPPLLGAVGVLPCLAGLVAVTLLWRRRPGAAA